MPALLRDQVQAARQQAATVSLLSVVPRQVREQERKRLPGYINTCGPQPGPARAARSTQSSTNNYGQPQAQVEQLQATPPQDSTPKSAQQQDQELAGHQPPASTNIYGQQQVQVPEHRAQLDYEKFYALPPALAQVAKQQPACTNIYAPQPDQAQEPRVRSEQKCQNVQLQA